MTYGVPYLGSKNRVAKELIDQLPEGKRFVDLFAGGCAVSHAAMLSGKWERILNNDPFPLHGQTLFRLACEGEYKKEKYYRIVWHDEFYEKRDVEPHIIAIWGWNQTRTHIGRPFQRFCGENGITDIRQLKGKDIDHNYKKPLGYLYRLQELAGLDLSKADFTQADYKEYEYEDGDVVYCDPPYEGSDHRYGRRFDSGAFWDWVRTRDYPVYVSEYKAPDDFVAIWEKHRLGI